MTATIAYTCCNGGMRSLGKAFRTMNRKRFVPPEQQDNAGLDVPLPIGFGQANSQPSVVRTMLEWLDVGPGDKVLDVGSGSGWTTALIGYMVNPATVYAVEKIPELVSIGRHNCEEGGVRNAVFFEAAHTMGLPAYAPFDRILVSASANALPAELITQLKEGGKMVIPVGNTILEITKKTTERIEVIPHHGYAFVPLTP